MSWHKCRFFFFYKYQLDKIEEINFLLSDADITSIFLYEYIRFWKIIWLNVVTYDAICD